jgi:sortase (surface protein transpeptidase)
MTETMTPEFDVSESVPARSRSWRTVAIGVATVFATVAVFFGLFAFVLSGIQEQRSQQQLYAQFRGLIDPSSPLVKPTGGVIKSGTPVAILNSAAAGLHDLMVVEGTSSGTTFFAPGHLRNSPLPGQRGDSLIIGRSVTSGAPFGTLTSLKKGDDIKVTTAQGIFRYVVLDHRVAGDQLTALPPSGSLLTLVTATGSSWLGDLAPTHLYYVDAALVGRTVTAPSGRPLVVTPAEIQGHGDPNAWPYVIFWLEAVLLAAIGVVWLWSKWPWWRAWLVSVPVVFAVLWGLSTELLRLLPNVY